ncbi:carbonic anhydrase [Granulicella pectinivorans]|jgi:carbonic anhydrase|uniref:carbonic anhydrase n=1 Tax=Granulicella pectinivorans TaxID=474950 RepID=A0A1I6L6N1_9BACT|nr:carbonic anhydrase [Granulicella pectinivorans]SFR99119.1 carbonic anhydrase [Granulicella pectinivorans]
MEDILSQLKAGIRRFRTEVYPEQAEKFQTAATTPQTPHALIITCADSRIDAESITSSGVGDVFITRNIGNLVPPYGEMLGGVSAVIEYAVSALKVKHIAICGHTDCGAMKALLNPAGMESMPTVKTWMRNAAAALSVADSLTTPEDTHESRLKKLTYENVLLQMQHLRTHPSVAGAMAREELTISGWVYNIGTGEVRITEDGSRNFYPVTVEGDLSGDEKA